MKNPTSNPSATSTDQSTYGEGYFLHAQGSCYKNFRYMPEVSNTRAGAFVDAADLPKGAAVLDYGCGMGGVTAGLLNLGYKALGVDVSEWAVTHCLAEVEGSVRHLSEKGLSEFADDEFDLVIAKDVFEHIPKAELQPLMAEMLRIAPRAIFLVPACDEQGHFLRSTDEDDATHITRLTKQQWLDLFPYDVRECPEVPATIKGEHAYGSFCAIVARQ